MPKSLSDQEIKKYRHHAELLLRDQFAGNMTHFARAVGISYGAMHGIIKKDKGISSNTAANIDKLLKRANGAVPSEEVHPQTEQKLVKLNRAFKPAADTLAKVLDLFGAEYSDVTKAAAEAAAGKFDKLGAKEAINELDKLEKLLQPWLQTE